MLPYHGKKAEAFWCPREGKIARKLKHPLPPSVKVGRNLTLFVFSVKFSPKFAYSLLRGYPHRERLVDGRFPSIVKIRKVDLVSSVLCGRDFFLFLSIIIYPIFPLFPEHVLSYLLATFAQIYPQKQYIYPTLSRCT